MNRTRRRYGPSLNWQLIIPVSAGVLVASGLGLAACFAVAVIGDDGGEAAFGITAAAALPVGGLGLLSARRLRSMPLIIRDGFAAVTAAWLTAAIVGAVPFLIAGTFDRPVEAFFESMSGFTTTGATLIDDVDAEPDAVLLWRSLLQWLGGVGIVVLVVAIAPATGLASQRVFYAETSGITADRLTPRIADTAKIIWGIYLTLTALALMSYWVAGMSAWDAVNHSLTTLATGGFSTHTASLAAFDSLAIELVAIVFMAAGGVNFAFYWRAVRGGSLWPEAAEIRLYFLILVASIAAVTASLVLADDVSGVWNSLRASAFTVTSLITTTGFTTDDYDLWGDYARWHLLVLMFIGGCAGSTAGGMKVTRIMLLGKAAAQEIARQLRPKAVQVLRTRGRVYGEDVRLGVLGFFYIYMTVAIAGTFAMTAAGLDFDSALSSVAATLNVVGPGLGAVGGIENYAAVPEGGLLVLSALMLIGRLEVFTVLVLLTRVFWRPRGA